MRQYTAQSRSFKRWLLLVPRLSRRFLSSQRPPQVNAPVIKSS